jgi:pilus assembly protein Flp/PilA
MIETFAKRLVSFYRDEAGLSAVEYGLLAAGIVVGLYTLIAGIGTSLRGIYSSVASDLSGAG